MFQALIVAKPGAVGVFFAELKTIKFVFGNCIVNVQTISVEVKYFLKSFPLSSACTVHT